MANLEKGFLVLYDWLPAIETLPAKDLKTLILALINLQKNGIPLPHFTNKKAEVYAQMIEPTIRRRLEGKRSVKDTTIPQGTPEGTPRGTSQATPRGTSTPKQRERKEEAEKRKAIAESNAPTKEGSTQKSAYGEFANVFLTEDEYASLTDKYGKSVANGLIDNFSIKLKAKGYQYDDHYATILDWANKDGIKPQSEKSYDVEDFFQAALMRSYENLEGE